MRKRPENSRHYNDLFFMGYSGTNYGVNQNSSAFLERLSIINGCRHQEACVWNIESFTPGKYRAINR